MCWSTAPLVSWSADFQDRKAWRKREKPGLAESAHHSNMGKSVTQVSAAASDGTSPSSAATLCRTLSSARLTTASLQGQ